MNALRRSVCALALVVVGAASLHAAEVTDRFRSAPFHVQPGFSGNYLKDSATVDTHQFRGEFFGSAIPHFHRLEVRYYDFVASYGILPNTEIGVAFPLLDLIPRRAACPRSSVSAT